MIQTKGSARTEHDFGGEATVRGERTGLEIACSRCRRSHSGDELRLFGDKRLCRECLRATIELARAGIRSMSGSRTTGRVCENCQALARPEIGSPWCAMTELGGERAHICAKFAPLPAPASTSTCTRESDPPAEIWRTVAAELRIALGDDGFESWFGTVRPVAVEAGKLILAVPDEFSREWLERRLRLAVQSALSLAGYSSLSPQYVLLADSPDAAAGTPHAAAASPKIGFNPHYVFAEFVVGPANQLAHASALACVEQQGRVYNPLVIHGGVGVGKTHLLQAIGQKAIDAGRGEVILATSEAFTNELILAIRGGSTADFRARYRNADYLLLDDIQFIAGKEATQEEFFHTFNALHQSGKQIVLTSDRSPSELGVLQDRLKSRFAWGLTTDVRPPDLATRIAIVRRKAAFRGQSLDEDVVHELAKRSGSNVRELEGALNRLMALSKLLGDKPDRKLLSRVVGEAASGAWRAADVVQAVCVYFSLKSADLEGPQRIRGIARARQIAMYLLREEAKLSLVEIGRHLGDRNHSTVVYGAEKVSRELRSDCRVGQDVEGVRRLLYSGVAG